MKEAKRASALHCEDYLNALELETKKLVQEVIIVGVPPATELAATTSKNTWAVSFSVPNLLLARNLSFTAQLINTSGNILVANSEAQAAKTPTLRLHKASKILQLFLFSTGPSVPIGTQCSNTSLHKN